MSHLPQVAIEILEVAAIATPKHLLRLLLLLRHNLSGRRRLSGRGTLPLSLLILLFLLGLLSLALRELVVWFHKLIGSFPGL